MQSGSVVVTGDGSPESPWILDSAGLTVVTSGTRPGTPFLSQTILETDTDRIYYWDGSDWRIIHDPHSIVNIASTVGVNVDSAGTGVYSDWYTIGNVTVPPWATIAVTSTSISRIVAVTTGVIITVRLSIGTNAETNGSTAGVPDVATGSTPLAWNGQCAVTPGVQPVTVEIRNEFADTDIVRLNAFFSRVAANIFFKEA
jgi:hypothetical protein